MVGRPEVMDLLATNVSVITALSAGTLHGSTANCWGEKAAGAAALVTLARGGRTHRAVLDSGVFGVSVLAADQAALARRFARRERTPGERFAGVETVVLPGDPSGVPVLADCLASFVCTVQSVSPFGTYDVVVGEVAAARRGRPGAALVYFDREFGSTRPLGPEPAGQEPADPEPAEPAPAHEEPADPAPAGEEPADKDTWT